MGAHKNGGWLVRRSVDIFVGRDRRVRKDTRLGHTQMTHMVLDLLYITRWIPWAVMIVIALVMLGPDLYNDARFYVRPIAVMKGDLVTRTDDYIRIHITGEKVRGVECKYLGIQAFGDRAVGSPVDLTIRRVGLESEGLTKPAGKFDIGTWELRPSFGIITARIYTTHDCEGTLWPTKIAEVSL
jgi:hypothetical protein